MKTDSESKRILLIGNSTLYGSGYLDHAEGEIRDFLGDVRRVLFVPYALYDRAAYSAMARARFKAMGYELDSIHEASDAPQAVHEAEALFIGGGNTFRLLKSRVFRRGHDPVEIEPGMSLDHLICQPPD